MTRERSLTLYEATFANGILSKMCVGLKVARVGDILCDSKLLVKH